MMARDFDNDLAYSKDQRLIKQWDMYWKLRYPQYTINRKISVDTDKVGTDVVLINKRGYKIEINEKVTDVNYPNYPVEVMMKIEPPQIDGWGYTLLGKTVAIQKVVWNKYQFVGDPVVFKIEKTFRPRILTENRGWEVFYLKNNRGNYTSKFYRVPAVWLENYHNDWWFCKETGETLQHKLGEY